MNRKLRVDFSNDAGDDESVSYCPFWNAERLLTSTSPPQQTTSTRLSPRMACPFLHPRRTAHLSLRFQVALTFPRD